jgi:hypothetical protein
MTPDDIKRLIESSPDFITLGRFECSLEKLLQRYPDGCPDHIICNALSMPKEEVEKLNQEIVEKLRKQMKVVV